MVCRSARALCRRHTVLGHIRCRCRFYCIANKMPIMRQWPNAAAAADRQTNKQTEGIINIECAHCQLPR